MCTLKVLLCLAVAEAAIAAPPNWLGEYSRCSGNSELLRRDHVDLRVRISTANAALAREFSRALRFWSRVVDLDWREVDSGSCTIQLVDGTPNLFDAAGTAARSQFPDRAEFQGWIAFNPAVRLTEHEMFMMSVHEIGHLLGLPHNPSCASVMYFLDLDGPMELDAVDLSILALRHRLRDGFVPASMARAVVQVR